GAWLGPRWNEPIGLRRCDPNPLRQEIAFGEVVVNQNGSQTCVERLSKTEDFRTIPVPQPVMDRLLEHLATYCPDAGREDFLFLTRNGTHPLRANVARDVLRAAVRRAGLQRHVTWLTLRHTAASLMFDAGLTLFEVQQRLGHKSPTMTAEVYTHLMRERFDEGRQRMEDYMLTRRRADLSDNPRWLGSSGSRGWQCPRYSRSARHKPCQRRKWQGL
ncbi:MAG: tyrosine-type recombinase/integrase, partial [Chloroflexota bacterium]|nr:tyrosine-type recombinase/integrase [Chloroflexota bacterium]